MASRKKIKVAVVVNRQKPGALSLLRELQNYEEASSDIEFLWEKSASAMLRTRGHELVTLLRKADLLLVAGGDGSLLQVAHKLFPAQVPILGVNLGSLGFLTSLAQTEVLAALPQIAAGRWRPSPRLALETTIHRGREKTIVPCALNDVVVSRGARSQLVHIRVQVGHAFVTEYECDGLIVSTPTGSTAYSVSAGGPMISPETRALALTPICPHTLTNRSLIVGTDCPIRLQVPSQPSQLTVQIDGQTAGTLRAGDWLEVKPASAPVILAYTRDRDFYTILRQKLKWSGASV
jgi:NAD+ kinase